jgi:hypothetical protein
MKKEINYLRNGIILIVLLNVFMYGCKLKTGKNEAVRDKLWIWGHYPGVYTGNYGLKGVSSMSPVEGAKYMGLTDNLIFVIYNGLPKPPYEEYAASFNSFKQLYWSIVAAGGITSDEEIDKVIKLASGMKNIKGVIMDDFFNDTSASITVEKLKVIHEKFANVDGRKLDVAVTLYTNQLNHNIKAHLEQCDVITLWTWLSRDLVDLEYNFSKLKKIAPDKRILLGIYMWDYGAHKPIPLDVMKSQCNLGLKWLKSGEIDGMIFLGTNICDLNIESVEWTKKWISEVGDVKL